MYTSQQNNQRQHRNHRKDQAAFLLGYKYLFLSIINYLY